MEGLSQSRLAPNGLWQRSKLSRTLNEYRHLKLLPHINGEYEFRITNQLLRQKIANPRRDRIIMDSLEHTASAHLENNKKKPQSKQGLLKYRRKYLLTAAAEKRHSSSSVPKKKDQKRDTTIGRRQLQGNRRDCYSKNDENGSMGENSFCAKKENQSFWEAAPEWVPRNNYVGKIVKNHSAHLLRISKGDHPACRPSEATLGEDQQLAQESTQQKIKKIVRKIYQFSNMEKENQS